MIWLVYQPPNVPPETLSLLLYAVLGWPMKYPKLLVPGNFSVHAGDATFSQAADLVASMAALGLSQTVSVPMHQAGRTLDLIFVAELSVDLETTDTVLWSDHLVLKAQLGMSPVTYLGSE